MWMTLSQFSTRFSKEKKGLGGKKIRGTPFCWIKPAKGYKKEKKIALFIRALQFSVPQNQNGVLIPVSVCQEFSWHFLIPFFDRLCEKVMTKNKKQYSSMGVILPTLIGINNILSKLKKNGVNFPSPVTPTQRVKLDFGTEFSGFRSYHIICVHREG